MHIIDPFLPRGKVNLLAGSPGVGKSTLLHLILDKIRRGEPVADYPSRSTRIVYIGADGDLDTYRALEHRLAVKPFEHINIINEAVQRKIHPMNLSLDWLWNDYLRKLRPELVVFDPADLLIGIKNFNDKYDVASGFFRLLRWTKEHNLTVINVMHTNKTKKSDDYFDVFNRIAGSVSIQAYCSTKALLLSAQECPDKKTTLYLRGKDYPEQKFHFERTPNGGFKLISADDLLREEYAILQAFNDDELSTAEIAEIAERDAGISRSTVYRQLQLLKQEGLIEQPERGFWRLKGLQ